jgi:hypothetical protein
MKIDGKCVKVESFGRLHSAWCDVERVERAGNIDMLPKDYFVVSSGRGYQRVSETLYCDGLKLCLHGWGRSHGIRVSVTPLGGH